MKYCLLFSLLWTEKRLTHFVKYYVATMFLHGARSGIRICCCCCCCFNHTFSRKHLRTEQLPTSCSPSSPSSSSPDDHPQHHRLQHVITIINTSRHQKHNHLRHHHRIKTLCRYSREDICVCVRVSVHRCRCT